MLHLVNSRKRPTGVSQLFQETCKPRSRVDSISKRLLPILVCQSCIHSPWEAEKNEHCTTAFAVRQVKSAPGHPAIHPSLPPRNGPRQHERNRQSAEVSAEWQRSGGRAGEPDRGLRAGAHRRRWASAPRGGYAGWARAGCGRAG